jgi:hypothetical protein
MSWPLRLRALALPPSTHTNTRTPSHLNSKAQPGPVGSSSAVASMGDSRSGRGVYPSGGGSMRWIIHWEPPVGNST